MPLNQPGVTTPPEPVAAPAARPIPIGDTPPTPAPVASPSGDTPAAAAPAAPAAAPAPRTPVSEVDRLTAMWDRGAAAAPATPAAPAAPAVPVSVEGEGEVPDGVPADVMSKVTPAPAAAPAAPATPAAPAPLDIDKIPDTPPEAGATEKSVVTWKALKAEAKRARQLEQEMAALKKAPPPPEVEEVAALKQQLTELENKVGQYDLTATRAFQQRYDVPLNQMYQRGLQLLVRSGKSPEDAQKVLQNAYKGGLTQEAIESALADETPMVQGALFTLFTDVGTVLQQRQAAIQDWQATQAALKESEERGVVASTAENIVKDTSEAIEELRKEGNWLFMESETDQAWNQKVHDRIRAVHGVLKTAKPAEMVKYVADGLTARTLRQLYQAERERNAKLVAELNKRTGVRPDLGGSISPAGARPADQPAGPRSPNAVIDQLFSGPRTVSL